MKKTNRVALFEGKQIRRHWDDKKELWYFAIMDIIQTLVQTDRPRKYWNDLKTKLKHEGSELSEKIGQLKMQAADGKYYLTDVADTEVMLRLIQSIPSPNAEPFNVNNFQFNNFTTRVFPFLYSFQSLKIRSQFSIKTQ
jgi:hypothetical protein